MRSAQILLDHGADPLTEQADSRGDALLTRVSRAWQQAATTRMLLAYQWAQPGKKLVFMGMELGQRSEWAHEGSLDWDAADEGLMRCIADLNEDGRINGFDIGRLLAEWNNTVPLGTFNKADLNRDGIINGEDLGLMLNAWGKCNEDG